MSKLHKNLGLVCWYQAIQKSLLPIAIITLFWKHRLGLSMTEIMFLQAYFSLCVGLFEFPSGYLADQLGYRLTLIIAAITGSLGWAVYSICDGFWQIMFASTILGISLALVSGSPEALVYECLKESDEEDTYVDWHGKLMFWGQISEGCFALLAGVLYSISYRLPFYVQIFISLIGVWIAYRMIEPPRQKVHQDSSHYQEIKKLLSYSFIEHIGFRKIMIFSVILNLASFIPVWLIQIHAKDIGYSFFVLGIFWSAANFMVAFGAISQSKLSTFIKPSRILLICIILVAIGYLGVGSITFWLGPIFFLCITFVRGMQTPLIGQIMQDFSTSQHRASLLSVQSMAFRLVFLVVGPFIGWMVDKTDTGSSFLVVGSVITAMLSFSFFDVTKNVRHPYFRKA